LRDLFPLESAALLTDTMGAGRAPLAAGGVLQDRTHQT